MLALIPFIIIQPARWAREQIRTVDVSDVIAAAIGLVVGLVVAALLAIPLSQLKLWNLGTWLPSLAALLFAYLGMATAVLRKEDFGRLFSMAFADAMRAAPHGKSEMRSRKTGMRFREGRYASVSVGVARASQASASWWTPARSSTGASPTSPRPASSPACWSCRASSWKNCSISPTLPIACAAIVAVAGWIS